jgi:hypothetical protein
MISGSVTGARRVDIGDSPDAPAGRATRRPDDDGASVSLAEAAVKVRGTFGRRALAPRAVLTILGIVGAVVVWATYAGGGNPVDAYAYWSAGNRPDPYAPQACCDFVYSPPFLQAGWPLWRLPFEVFTGLLRAAELACVVAFAGPASAIALFLPPVATEINAANVNLLLMAAVVVGFRYPVAWTFVLLTKPTAALGLLWFVLRGEWRKAAIPIMATIAISAVSFVLAPDLWADYLSTLLRMDAAPGWPFPWPFLWRAPFALALIVFGARTDRRWAIVVGTILAMPRLYFLSPAMLLAVLPTLRRPVDLGDADLGVDPRRVARQVPAAVE